MGILEDKFNDWVDAAMAPITNSIDAEVDKQKAAINKSIGNQLQGFKNEIDAKLQVPLNQLNTVQPTDAQNLELEQAVNNMWASWGNVGISAWNLVQNAITNIVHFAANIAVRLWDIIATHWAKAFNDPIGYLINIVSNLYNLGKSLVELVVSFFSTIVTFVLDIVEDTWNLIVSLIQAIWFTIETIALLIAEWVAGYTNDVISWFNKTPAVMLQNGAGTC